MVGWLGFFFLVHSLILTQKMCHLNSCACPKKTRFFSHCCFDHEILKIGIINSFEVLWWWCNRLVTILFVVFCLCPCASFKKRKKKSFWSFILILWAQWSYDQELNRLKIVSIANIYDTILTGKQQHLNEPKNYVGCL